MTADQGLPPREELTYDTAPSPQFVHDGYQPLQFAEDPPPRHLTRRVAQRVLNDYASSDWSISNWDKAKRFTVTWTPEKTTVPLITPITFREVERHLAERRTLDADHLKLPKQFGWLDSSVAVTLKSYFPANGHPSSLAFDLPPNLGPEFPVTPSIDREGIAFSSTQLYLLQTIYRIRARLVNGSSHIFEIDGDWLNDLFSYCNLTVAAVDTTLMQVYYKAKYDGARMGWAFEVERLGGTTNRRMEDKLAWVGRITGRDLDNARQERESLKRIREVRNHLNHFDPPVLAFTIEDVAGWLNLIYGVASLLWKIRDRIRAPLCEPLIKLLLCPKVRAVPRDAAKVRHPQHPSAGYASSTWPPTPQTQSG